MEYMELRNLWLSYGKEIFDTFDDFSTWLNRHNFIFGGEKPINTDIEFIKQKLTGMQYGDNI